MDDAAVHSSYDLAVEVRKIIYRRVALGLTCTGAIVFLTAYCVAVYYDIPPRFRRGHRPYLLALLVVCLLHILVVIFTGVLFAELMFDPNAAGEQIFMFEDLNAQNLTFKHWTTNPSQALITIGLWIVDGVMMARCYIMYHDRKWVCIFPGVLYLASMALGITWVVVLTKGAYRGVKIAWSLTAVLFNILVTSLIGTRLILADRDLRLAASSTTTTRWKFGFSRPIKLLVESAVPPTVLGVVVIILFAVPKPTTPDAILRQRHYLDFLNVLYYEVAVLSPLLIIFRVMTGKSKVWSDRTTSTRTAFEIARRSSVRDRLEDDSEWAQSTEAFGSQSRSMEGFGSQSRSTEAYGSQSKSFERAHPLKTLPSGTT